MYIYIYMCVDYSRLPEWYIYIYIHVCINYLHMHWPMLFFRCVVCAAICIAIHTYMHRSPYQIKAASAGDIHQ